MHHYVGQRLSTEGYRCTVRYIGEVKTTTGEWLGVEWDDESKGKNDGSITGHRYFTCRSSAPNTASFIRPSRRFDKPESFLEALNAKYRASASEEELVSISGRTVEEVGFDKIQQQLSKVHELKEVILDRRCITVDEDHREELSRAIESLDLQATLLDLGYNLIETWDDIIWICRHLKHLKSLRLQGNKFRDTTCSIFEENFVQTSFFSAPSILTLPSITELILDETLMSWDEIASILRSLPSLLSLSLRLNGLGKLQIPLKLINITAIDLSQNQIRILDSLAFLINPSHLAYLNLSSNPLQSVTSSYPIAYRALQRLLLAETDIADFDAFSFFPSIFPKVTHLVLTSTPLAAKYKDVRLLTIGRLANLTNLNGSNISPEERLNAELFYLSSINREFERLPSQNQQQDEEFLKRHPRAEELWDAYGRRPATKADAAAAATQAAHDPNSMAARVTLVTAYIDKSVIDAVRAHAREGPSTSLPARSKDLDNGEEGKRASKPASASSRDIVSRTFKVPQTTDIYALRGLVARVFGLPYPCSTRIRLFRESEEWDPGAAVVAAEEDEEDEEEDVEGNGSESCSDDEKERMKEEGGKGANSSNMRTIEVELKSGTRRVLETLGEGGSSTRIRVEVSGGL